MKALALVAALREEGDWVDWSNTCDLFLAGDPEREVSRIAVSWSCTLPRLRRAVEAGCELLVTHEPLYTWDENPPGGRSTGKAAFLAESGLVVYRCHDFWDVYPGLGIVDSWSAYLGFSGPPAATARFYNAHDLPEGTTLGALARTVLEKVKPLGQEHVGIVGDPDGVVHRIAVGTGAITHYADMAGLGADALLLTDDGTRLWESACWAEDAGVGLILVNHATAEEPGVANLARWLAERTGLPTLHLPQGCLYRSLGES